MAHAPTVLWLDDDNRKLRIVRDLLGSLGAGLVYARTVEEAAQIMRQWHHLPVLILDAILPSPTQPESENELSTGGARRDSMPISYSELERSGLCFLDLCQREGLSFEKVVLISFVKEEELRRLGYRFDAYFNKLSLPDQLDALRAEIAGVVA